MRVQHHGGDSFTYASYFLTSNVSCNNSLKASSSSASSDWLEQISEQTEESLSLQFHLDLDFKQDKNWMQRQGTVYENRLDIASRLQRI